ERRAACGAGRSASRSCETSSTAPLRRQCTLVGSGTAGEYSRIRRAPLGPRARRLLDHRRYRASEVWPPFGRRGPSILWATGQTGQLPGGGEFVVGHSRRQRAGGLSAVSAGGVGPVSVSAKIPR